MGSDRPTRGALTVTREIRRKIENVIFFSRYREKLKETFLSSAELSRFRTLFFAVGDFGGTCLDTYEKSKIDPFSALVTNFELLYLRAQRELDNKLGHFYY